MIMMRSSLLYLAAVLICFGSIARAAEPTLAEKTQALADEWAAKFKAEGFHVTVTPQFVIAGNMGDAALARYRDHTIVGAQKALSALYFKKPIEQPILILLFDDADTYKRLADKWFDYRDVPHFGFYMNSRHAMLMNITTGGGTLVHELTHAMIAPDFPDVPDWFNEGLASLYEQSSMQNNTIVGLPNWRLPALQKAIKENTLRPLQELIEDKDFRDAKLTGINYTQARYLMHYLQDKGQLTTYYKAFRDGHEKDPTGLATLKTLIAPKSLEDFEKEWRAWVLTLKYE